MSAGQPVRVALLVPNGPDRDRWIRVLADYAFGRGWGLASICSTAQDALQELAAGRAERILVVHAYQLAPLINVLTAERPDAPQAMRRPQRVWRAQDDELPPVTIPP